MTNRDALIDALEVAFPSPHLLDESGLRHTADALIAAGWRLVPTEGPAFDAMVERAARAVQDAPLRDLGKAHIIDPTSPLTEASIRAAKAALRAALGGNHG